jgi:hypothetical protein
VDELDGFTARRDDDGAMVKGRHDLASCAPSARMSFAIARVAAFNAAWEAPKWYSSGRAQPISLINSIGYGILKDC